jgi:hypothetical protein
MQHNLTLPSLAWPKKTLLALGVFLASSFLVGNVFAVPTTCNLTTTGTCPTQCTVTVVITDTGADENGPCGATAHLFEVSISAVCGAATCGPTTYRRCGGSSSPVTLACNGHTVTDTPTTTWGGAFSGACTDEQTATCS